MKRFLKFPLLCGLSLMLGTMACGDKDEPKPNPEPEVQPLKISMKDTMDIKHGDVLKLISNAKEGVTWQVGDTTVAVIDVSQTALTGRLLGQTKLIATKGNESDTVVIRVKPQFTDWVEPLYGEGKANTATAVSDYEKMVGRTFFKRLDYTDDQYIMIYTGAESNKVKRSCYIMSAEADTVMQAWFEPRFEADQLEQTKAGIKSFLTERYFNVTPAGETKYEVYRRGWAVVKPTVIGGALNIQYQDARRK